jgi:hypothetical protein
MQVEERNFVAEANCNSAALLATYKTELENIIFNRTNEIAKELTIDEMPEWAQLEKIPSVVLNQCKVINKQITVEQWQQLKVLQRFALVKLCNSSHENKNLPHALIEFELV